MTSSEENIDLTITEISTVLTESKNHKPGSVKKWNVLKIKDFAEVVTGGTPSTSVKEYWEGGDILWLNSGELNQGNIFSSSNFITKKGLENSAAKLMPPSTVLIALTGATTGVVSYLSIEACANQSVTGILPSGKHEPKYLYYYLSSIRKKILSDSYGGAQKHISQGYVKEIVVPLPPLYIQQKIATILDKADALRKKDQQLSKKYHELLQSIFYKMFGDPVKNERAWKTSLFKELGSLDRGISKNRPRNAPELLGGKYPLVQTGDVANSNGYITTYKSTYSELGLRQSKLWKAGTLCITIAANIAKTGILTFEACFPDSIVGFIPNEKTNVEYIQWWLSHLQETLEKNAPESAQKNINLEILRNLSVPVPRINLQNKFAEIVKNIELQKNQVRKLMDNSESLFQRLLQKAFKGELIN